MTNYAGSVLATIGGLVYWGLSRFGIFCVGLGILAAIAAFPAVAVAFLVLTGVALVALRKYDRERNEVMQARVRQAHFEKYGRPAQPW